MLLPAFGLLLLQVSVSEAVLIATGDGTGNTMAPSGQPGFDNVGILDGLSGVYVRNGWVITTDHVGEHPFESGGILYEPIPGSLVQFQNSDASLADLIAFKLMTRPPLPDLALTDTERVTDTLITMVGNGRDRGTATTWMGLDGWNWDTGRTMRWGTNHVGIVDIFILGTHGFWVDFDDLASPPAGEHEADMVVGDSGGAAFTGTGATERLAGILFARSASPAQPAATSL